MMPPDVNTSAGDWLCGSCGTWNQAQLRSCIQCNAPSPVHFTMAGMVAMPGLAMPRFGLGGGIMEVGEEDANRKRRAIDMQRENEQRRVDKKKCDICRRFACIC